MQELEREFNFKLMKYFNELKKSMNYLAKNKKTIFIGQAVEVPGTSMSNTLKEINPNKLLELPVAEELQMGITTGLALNGSIPVSIFPRWNFLILAMNQLINHLDKINIMSNNGYIVKTIIRTAVGSQRPLHPQHQHVGDFTDQVKKMCTYECLMGCFFMNLILSFDKFFLQFLLPERNTFLLSAFL